MVETTTFPGTGGTSGTDDAKSHFTKAVDEAIAGAKALGSEAQTRAEEYREKVQSKLHDKADGLTGDAKARTEEYKEKAYGLADEGKARASGALSSLSQLI